MLTPKQKKQLRILISKNPDVEYQEKLDDSEQFALKEIKKFCERESIILKRQVEALQVSLKILDGELQQKEDEGLAIKNQQEQVSQQIKQLLKQLELLSDK